MKWFKRSLHTLFIVVFVIIILFPPFYGFDVRSQGRIHVYMGHRPVWKTIAPEEVYLKLLETGRTNESDNIPIEDSGIPPYAAHFNTVRFAAELLLVIFAWSLLFFVIAVIIRMRNKYTEAR